ncbi:MAG: CinA family nicotinamide mononucleotide deamidase-related protein [Nannocystaceae bacterium]
MDVIRANIVTIGDEIIAGDVVDTNRAYLGRRCRALGIDVIRGVSVRDRAAEIADVLVRCSRDVQICLVSGGLGPTTDDVTAEAVARAAGTRLVRDERVVGQLRAFFAERGGEMASSNLKQADLPQGCTVLDNPIGTAPGFSAEIGEDAGHSCTVICMPGVPRELRRMMADQVEPRLLAGHGIRPVELRTYRFIGIGESKVQELIGSMGARRDVADHLDHMFVHYRARALEVLVTFEYTGVDRSRGREALSVFDGPMHELFRRNLYGIGTADLATRVVGALTGAGLSVGVAESCTGGLLGSMLTQVAGASACFRGGVIAYDNGVKCAVLGIPAAALREHGAVSEHVAVAMGDRARSTIGTDLGVGITGIAGPSGGTPEKPVGTVHVAVTDTHGVSHKSLRATGDRGDVRHHSAMWALKLVWDRLLDQGLARVGELADPQPPTNEVHLKSPNLTFNTSDRINS